MVSIGAVILKLLGDLIGPGVLIPRGGKRRRRSGCARLAILRHAGQAPHGDGSPHAVQGLREADRGPGLPDPARAVEEIRLRHAIVTNRGEKSRDDLVLITDPRENGPFRQGPIRAHFSHASGSIASCPRADLEVKEFPFTESVSPTSAIFWPSVDLLAGGDEDARAVRIERIESTAVVHDHTPAVAR